MEQLLFIEPNDSCIVQYLKKKKRKKAPLRQIFVPMNKSREDTNTGYKSQCNITVRIISSTVSIASDTK